VNNQNIINRIKKILTYYEISASKFADSIQVQRSSISHLLSGRNKPSLDFILKIINQYEEVSLNWLLLGEGTFPKSVSKVNLDSPTPLQQDLFNQNLTESIKKPDLAIAKPTVVAENTSIDINATGEIEQIVIFYKNGSFRNYK
jgi:transcriptional regulator with XRE-family HTH domain